MWKVEPPFELEANGLNRDQDFVYALYDWYVERVPVSSAFSLWYLRDCQTDDGAIYRSQSRPVPEVNPVLRFMHFARTIGEDLQDDTSLRRAAEWVLRHQLPDGSMPSKPSESFGESGTTARAVRAIDGLGGDYDVAAARMRLALARHVRQYKSGMAWCARDGREHPATGATSLAVLALSGGGPAYSGLLSSVGTWLLSQQSSTDGGWAELSGAESTAHNTFNALRALCELDRSRLISRSTYERAWADADTWFTSRHDLAAGRIIDVGFAVRLGALLQRADQGTTELVIALADRSSEALDGSSDAYDTELLGLALLEWSNFADRCGITADWRWKLPALLPPFARSGTELYDVLYLASERRQWRRLIDWFVKHQLIESVGGRILGLVTALAVVDERAVRYLGESGHVAISLGVTMVIFIAAASWVVMRLLATARWKGVASSLLVSVGLGSVIADIDAGGFHTSSARLNFARVAVAILAALIVDAVSYTADRSGLVSRFLPTE